MFRDSYRSRCSLREYEILSITESEIIYNYLLLSVNYFYLLFKVKDIFLSLLVTRFYRTQVVNTSR